MSGMYDLLAPLYDRLNGGADYARLSDYAERQFARYFPAGVKEVLDLACGTGRLTAELARRGYDMTGVDLSEEMLSEARDHAEREGLADKILFLCQDMCDFELYGTVDAVVCSFDAVNHVTARADLSRCFHWVHNYLVPGGLFLFDVNTPYKFRTVYGDRAYVLETGNATCLWQNDYREKAGVCDFLISLFTRDRDGRYTREDTCQREKVYTLRALRRLLAENRLELLSLCADTDGAAPTETSERWYITARAVKP